MTLRLRLRLLVHDLRRRQELALATVMRHAPRWLLRAAVVEVTVRATSSTLIGGHAYAGPDGVDFERMMWAVEGKLPPGREAEITAPV
jgi:hypothetical protein